MACLCHFINEYGENKKKDIPFTWNAIVVDILDAKQGLRKC